MKLRAALIIILAILTGCASMNDAMTPSVQVVHDDFDGATIVRQEPVSAASSMSEAWHVLGMEWSSKTPDLVYVTAGVNGIVNIEGVAFNVDGQLIDNIKTASSITEYADWSKRRFVMSWQDFKTVASGRDVKMKVTMIDKYTVSSFGSNHPGATINTKLAVFVAKVDEMMNAPAK